MDIYEIDKNEGRRLIGELDKLRRKKNNGKIVVKCERTNNNEVKYFRSCYVLSRGLTEIFAKTEKYFIEIGDASVIITLVFTECHIVYELRKENDWKLIEVEIIDNELCNGVIANKTEIFGRAEVAAFSVIVNFSNKYGFSKVFDVDDHKCLEKLFGSVINNENLNEYEFGLEEKILTIISKNGLKKDFVDKYVINLQGETKK